MTETFSEYYLRMQKEQEKRNAFAANVVLQSVKTSPDEFAGDLKLAQEYSQTTGAPRPPVEMVQQYRSLFQQKVEEARNMTFLSGSPKLAEWLRNPENAALSRDVIAELSWFEGFGRGLTNTSRRAIERLSQMGNQLMFEQTSRRARDRGMTFGEILEEESLSDRFTDQDGKPIRVNDGSNYVRAFMRWVDARYADIIGTDDEAATQRYASALADNVRKLRSIPKSEIATAFEQEAMQSFAAPQNDLTGKKSGNWNFANLTPFDPGDFIRNEDGSISTERTVTIQLSNGKWVNIPTLWKNDEGYVDFSDREGALRNLLANYEYHHNQKLPRYDTVDEAVKAAQERSESGGAGSGYSPSFGEAIANFASAAMKNPVGALAWMLETAGESAPQLAAALGTTLLTRNPAAGVAVGAGGAYATERYLSPAEFFEEKGLDLSKPEDVQKIMNDPALMQEAAERGVIRGLVIGTFAALSMGLAGQAFSRNPLVDALAQGLTQSVMGSGGEYFAQSLSGQEIDWNEILAEGFAEFATTPVDVGIAGRRFIRQRRDAEEAEETARRLKETLDAAGQSILRDRAPDRFRDFVARATEGTDVENVFVDAEKFVEYFQDMGVDPFEIAETLDGVGADELRAGLLSGDLRIPLSTVTEAIPGSGHEQFFLDHARFDPGDMSPSMAAEFNDRVEEIRQEMWELAEQQWKLEQEYRTFEQEIRDTVISRLRAAGMGTEYSTTAAELFSAFYRVMAERSGLTVEEFMQRYPLPQIRGDLPQGMQMRNVDALTRTLAEARAMRSATGGRRGRSLLEFIADHGGIRDVGGDVRSIIGGTEIKRGRGKKTLKIVRDDSDTDQGSMFGGGPKIDSKGRAHGLDDVAQAAVEAGFLADHPDVVAYKAAIERGDQVPDITRALLDAIDEEMRGNVQRAADDVDEARDAEEADDFLTSVERELDRLGVSLDDPDDVIRAAVEADQAERGSMYNQDGTINTESEAFKRWFGDSKVVDENGNPLVVYHGTGADFEAFDPERRGSNTQDADARLGFFLSSNPEIASEYASESRGRANVIPAYVSLQNPLIVDHEGADYNVNVFKRYINEAIAAGNDGVIIKNAADGFRYNDLAGDTVVAFSPTQIKSIFNRGTFDPADPRILFQPAPAVESEAFKRWFGDSKIVDEDGNPLVVYHGTASEFEAFSSEADAKHIKLPGFYFTPDPDVAERFSASASRREIRDEDGYIAGYEGAQIVPVYLAVQNPIEINLDDAETGRMTNADEVRSMLERAREEGHDGAIIRGWSDGSGDVQYVAFEPTQIKSVHNRGTWDANDPRILFQSAPPVESEAFKRWFGDSKVVDDQGKPLVVYHGSDTARQDNQDFSFEVGRTGKRFVGFAELDTVSSGLFFSPSREDAESYGSNVGEYYLSIQNPLVDPRTLPLSSRSSDAEKSAVAKAWDDVLYIFEPVMYVERDGNGEIIGWEIDTDGGVSTARGVDEDSLIDAIFVDNMIEWHHLDNPDVVERMKERGYDGVRVYEPNDQSGTSWFITDPRQAKSVYNRGAFDPNDPRIMYQRDIPVDGASFDAAAVARSKPDGVVSDDDGVTISKRGDSFIAEIDGVRVGELSLSWRGAYATSVEVNAAYRRRGIATKLYAAAERTIGRGMIPSPMGMSDDAVRFWKRRLSEMEPEQKQAALQEALDIGVSAGIPKSARERVDALGYREPKGGRTFYQSDTRNLYAVHNIKPAGVLNAVKLGGLPMPSVAVARTDKGFDNYGEISLIASPSLINPQMDRSVVAGNADLYTPRYPSVEYDVDARAFNELNKPLVAAMKEYGFDAYEGIDLSRLEDRGPGEGVYMFGMEFLYLQEKGALPNPVMKDGGPDRFANRQAIDKAMDAQDRADFEQWVSAKLEPLIKRERIFKGFTYSGNRRYVPHTLENVVKDMKSRMKEGEGFNYGVGNIRAKHAKRFRKIADMQNSRDKIVSEEEAAGVKDEFNEWLLRLAEAARPYYKFDQNSFGYMDEFSEVLGEIATKGWRALDEIFDGLPADTKTEIGEFLTALRDAPTEYFEAKFTRAVFLEEFAGALVPSGTSPEVVNALKSAGLRVVEYERGNAASKRDALQQFEQWFFQGARGSIQFPAGGVADAETIISLFQSRNLSTFLHESGHYFLQVMRDIAARGEGNAAADLQAVSEWWRSNADGVAKDAMRARPGVEVSTDDVNAWIDNGTTGDLDKDMAIDIGAHEQFARGFEQYLMEGKAPSVELRSAFEKFRAWLISVYRRLTGLNVQISDEMRAVFDRMLATDEEIAKAQESSGAVGPVFADAEQMGLTEEEYRAFLKMREKAEDEAKAKLLGEIMKPIKRENEKWFREERSKMRDEVEAEINAYRQYRAFEWMANRRWFGDGKPETLPDMRMSKDILVQRYGAGILRTLPRGRSTIYAVEGGLDPDDIAPWFGFSSGDEMVKSIESSPPRVEAIEAETDKRMRDKYGDVLNDGNVEVEALDAIHSERRGEWIAAELKAISEVADLGDRALSAKEARYVARQTIARMRVRDAMASNRFLANERKAAEEAARLGRILARESIWMQNARRRVASKAREVIRGEGSPDAVARQAEQASRSTENYNETVSRLVEAKRRQLINQMLYMESRKVADEVGKAERFVAKLQKSSHRQKIAFAQTRENAQVDYLAAIDELLERYDFRRMSGRQEDRRASLLAYVQSMTDAGRANELAIPDHVLQNAQRTPYKTLSVEELRGTIDALKNIEHSALRWNEFLVNQKKREFSEATGKIADTIRQNLRGKEQGWVDEAGWAAKGKKFVSGYIASVMNATTILRRLDGREDMGPVYELLKSDMDAAAYKELEMQREAAKKLQEIYDMYSPDEQREMGVKRSWPGLREQFSKWHLIMMALNMGNEGNLSRLTNKKAKKHLTEQEVEIVKSLLDERDARFVQSVWDLINSYWPLIEARDKRIKGVAPQKVEAKPVTIGGVELRGGYFPIMYDPRHGGARPNTAAAQDNEILSSILSGGYASAQTRNGHLKARGADVKQSLFLETSAINRHLNQVIHDLVFSEPVVNTWRMLNSNEVEQAFIDTGSQEAFDQLKLWVHDIATGQVGQSNQLARAVTYLRGGFAYSKLAFSLRTMLMQPLGVMQSAISVGKGRLARHMLNMMRHPQAIVQEVEARSSMMRMRRDTFNKDLMDAQAQSNIVSPAGNQARKFMDDVVIPLGMAGMVYTQYYSVDVPTWAAAFEKGMEKFNGDEAKSVQYADMTVQRSQGSGIWSDRSGVERGTLSMSMRQNPFVTTLTTLGTYFFSKMNMAIERTDALRAQPITMMEAMSYALDMAILFAGEAIVISLLAEMVSGDDEDDDDSSFAGNILKESAKTMAAGLPVVRDIASLSEGFDAGTYGALLKAVWAPAAQIGQGDFDRALVKSTVNLTGMLLRIPSAQINRSVVEPVFDAAEGDEITPMEYLFGKMKK